jgi:glucokinase
MYTLGVDIGGTKIAAALVDEKGSCFFKHQLPSIPDHSEKMFQQVVRCINHVMKKSNEIISDASDVKGIGIGVPGKVDIDNGLAVYQNNLPWLDFPIADRIRNIYNLPVVIDNDVRMAAYGEWANSPIRDSSFVYITWSTGIACSTIVNGKIIKGAGFAGEIGLSFLDSLSERLENQISGPALSRKGKGLIGDVKEIMIQYRNGNEAAIQIIQEAVGKLAQSIYTLICFLDPQKIVLGGSVITKNPFLLDILLSHIRRMVIPEQLESLNRLFVSDLEGEGGIIGAGLKSRSLLKQDTSSKAK